MKWSWQLIIFLYFGTSLLASVPPAISQKPTVTASEILSWINTDSSLSSPTVESIIAKLPEAYRRYFVLQYDSHSNHLSDRAHPRIIFFGPDAKLLFAASGLPSDPHYETIEMIEYEERKAEFSFYSIHFNETAKPKVEVNPQDCIRCHSSDPKPNWEAYSLWPGAYGSLHDRILPKTTEYNDFEAFLKTYKNHPRYRFLPSPFHMTTEDSFGTKTYYLSNGGIGPGSALSILLNFLNRDRIAKKIVASESHSRYRPALTAAMLGCPQRIDAFIPSDLRAQSSQNYDSVLSETETMMEKDYQRKLRMIGRLNQVGDAFIEPHADRFGFRKAEIERIAKLRFILLYRNHPLDFDRWALSIAKNSLDFNDGVSGLENLIGHYLPLAYNENESVRKSVSLKQTPFSFTTAAEQGSHHHTNDPLAYSLDLFSITGDLNPTCELLEKEAKALSFSQ
ncbi:MAG: hypothetical protein EB078_05555 [Proteobacteria bacterium]|nr:hypothetical protein [Pseudomonadota bacterium]NDC23446.1 hypothetical protein [Pseudomonadota bacterium]NDD04350.1 hypothetical protein [Pseudomonadota bacterium]NDG26673.1 hypothetical protein [Pseudomonadota bacterium]